MKSFAAAAVALLALAISAPARADVDFFVGASAYVYGSIMPDGDSDVLRFPVPAGSRLLLWVRSYQRDLDVNVKLSDPSGADVPLGVPATGHSVRTSRLRPSEGGVYALTVSGTGTGDYRALIRVSPPRTFEETRTIGPGNLGRQTFEVTGLPSSSIRVRVEAPDVAAPRLCTSAISEACPFESVRKIRFSDGFREEMRRSYEIWNAGDVAVEAHFLAKIRPPSLVPMSWDLRAASLGFPEGGETAVAVPWIPTKFTTVAVSTGSLAGTAIRWVAANTSDHLGTLGLTSVPDPSDAELEGLVKVGPTARFVSNFQRAPGERFGPHREPIVPPPNYAGHAYPMELPYDPALLPPGADAAIDVSVLRIGGLGRTSLMDRKFAVVDPDRHVVVLHGSKLDPFVRYCAVVAAD